MVLEHSMDAPADNPTPNVIKPYAPPNQRNRNLSRRKSGERFDRSNSMNVNDGDRSQVASSRNVHGDAFVNENARTRLITLDGCCSSEAFQLMNDRWAAALHSYNNPTNLSERPVIYSGGASAWGQFRLPHHIMSPTTGVGHSGSQPDFLAELSRAMRNANA